MKYLLPQGGMFYKANLHCHSLCSDGRFTPEELKAKYMEQGYSVIAYTDHGRLHPQNRLTDENFVALNGFEVAVVEYRGQTDHPRFPFRKNCDIGLIASDPDFRGDLGHTKHNGRYAPEVVNDIMKTYRDAGFFVIHNHPTWSMEQYPDYIQYQYMHAVEIVNYGACTGGFNEHNERVYDDMLVDGKRIFCIAADDNHNRFGRPDSFGGFTMIKAKKLDYRSIMDALFAGNFYASEGPEIRELYVDDNNILHIITSPAVQISVNTPVKPLGYINGTADAPVTQLDWKLDLRAPYFRIVVTDAYGKHAYSNAYFMDEILK